MFHKFAVALCALSLGACQEASENNAGTGQPAQADFPIGQLFAGKMLTSPSSGHDPLREFFYADGRWTAVFQAVGHVEIRGSWHAKKASDGDEVVCVSVDFDSRDRISPGTEICRSVKVTAEQAVEIDPILGPQSASKNRILVDIPG